LHIEPSTKCNAWCPACGRNQNGYGLAPDLVEQDLDITWLETVLESLPGRLDGIQFCGVLGDPCAHTKFLNLVKLAKKYTNKIQIHTNGGLRSQQWWSELAHLLSDVDHDVWFGIDGINEVHEIYRQGTSYGKVIGNATEFIKHGGHATWQFIPYQHNEHQIKECMKTSQQLGFKKFKLIRGFRDLKTQARHWQTGDVFQLEQAKMYSQVNIISHKQVVKKENCMHLSGPSAYISADKKISPCCYFYQTRSYDTITEMLGSLNIEQELLSPVRTCLRSCGTTAQ